MNSEYFNLFPVPIQKTLLELNIDSLIEFCYEMKCKDEKGVQISNVGGWQSDNIINETHTEFVKLKTEIESALNLYHLYIQLNKIFTQKISGIWVNINQKGHSNEIHNHAFSILSGAFYLTKGESAPIVFRHPYEEINTHYWNEVLIEEGNPINSGKWRIFPEPNQLIIFPAWLQHKVLMNEENIDRITFSFNTIV